MTMLISTLIEHLHHLCCCCCCYFLSQRLQSKRHIHFKTRQKRKIESLKTLFLINNHILFKFLENAGFGIGIDEKVFSNFCRYFLSCSNFLPITFTLDFFRAIYSKHILWLSNQIILKIFFYES